MPLKVWSGTSWVPAIALRVWSGSAWVAMTAGKVWNGSAWIQFFSSLAAAISATFVSGSASRAGAGSATVVASPTVVVTPSGGVAPYTYLWGYVSGVAAGFSLPSTGASMTFFRNMTVGIGQSITETGYYNCTVTDSVGNIFVTDNVEVQTILDEVS